MARRYTQEQKEFLKEQIPHRPHAEIAELFSSKFGIVMTTACVKTYATNHKIHRIKYYVTAEQVQYLKDNGFGNNDESLTRLFNTRFGTSYSIAKINNLRYKYGAVSGLKTRVPNAGQFRKGHVSHNKGKKQSEFMSTAAIERTKATRFKPGQTPPNHRHVGSTRVNVDGYVEIKTAEPNKWRMLHRVNWEKAHGPLTSEDLLIFLDGDRTNCDVSNLELIDKSTNARLNQRHLRSRYADVTKVAITLGRVIATTQKKILKGEEEND